MSGRRTKLLESLNISKLSHDERVKRLAGEVNFGNKNFRKPGFIKGIKLAEAKFKEIVSLYKSTEIGVFSSADSDAIGRYCLTHSEYVDMQELRLKAYDELDSNSFLKWLKESGIDRLIMNKQNMLLKLEEVLMLNPLAKLHNTPLPSERKTSEKKEDKSSFYGV